MKESVILTAIALVLVSVCVDWSHGQQRGSFNFAKKTGGEREGDLTPSAIAGVSIACVGALAGLVVTMFFCFYVYRQQKQQESFNSSFDPARKV
ncbi:hypothetical protein JTE90_023069 [Oedothorax gibbosus]|uniref:Uncharacterized protein n=1 Tax=Oedothorax gibbosus TaxID=931172 RepID=A0AAV6UYH4_9ARAC|nr:hypothetical protein JTE90_023069 [Oedothorax gibbosus]